MNNKDRFYALAFIFTIISIITAITIKYYGFDWFKIKEYQLNYSYYIESTVKFLILIVQYLLIVGCVTRYQFKELIFKMLPYLPLTILLYYLPIDNYVVLCGVIMFSTCLSISPKFKTMLRFITNILFILILQLIIIWLRLDLKQLAPVFPETLQFLIMNVDQIIVLVLLYYINRNEVNIMGWFFLGKANKKTFLSDLKKLGENICRFFKT